MRIRYIALAAALAVSLQASAQTPSGIPFDDIPVELTSYWELQAGVTLKDLWVRGGKLLTSAGLSSPDRRRGPLVEHYLQVGEDLWRCHDSFTPDMQHIPSICYRLKTE